MNSRKNFVTITIAIFLMLSISASTVLMPTAPLASAATLIETKGFTYAFPAVNGVGQTEFLNGWISPPMSYS